MNDTLPPGCPDPYLVVPYESARDFLTALTLASVGVIFGLTTVVAVLVVLVRRLNLLVAAMRRETGAEVRSGLLNGGCGGGTSKAAARPKEPPLEKNSGASCAEEEPEGYEEEDRHA